MEILLDLKTAKEQYAALQSEHTAQTALLEEANSQLQALTAQSQAKDVELSDAKALLTATLAELDTAKATIASLQATQKTAEAKAIELVAKQGVAPLKVDATEATPSLTQQDAINTYKALQAANKSYEAGVFYQKHKSLFRN